MANPVVNTPRANRCGGIAVALPWHMPNRCGGIAGAQSPHSGRAVVVVIFDRGPVLRLRRMARRKARETHQSGSIAEPFHRLRMHSAHAGPKAAT